MYRYSIKFVACLITFNCNIVSIIMRQSLLSLRGGYLQIKKENSININYRHKANLDVSMESTVKGKSSKKTAKYSMLTEENIISYLRKNETFLENYLMNEVEMELLEQWVIQRRLKYQQENNHYQEKVSRWKYCIHDNKNEILHDLAHALQIRPTKANVLWEISLYISSAINADDCDLYIVENGNADSLILYKENSLICAPNTRVVVSNSLPNYVARTKKTMRFSKESGHFQHEILNTQNVQHVLCIPVLLPDGDVAGVVQFYRKGGSCSFHEHEEEIAVSYLEWGGIGLHFAQLFINMNKQKKLNDFLLTVVKSVFQDMISVDLLVSKIINFAQRLVDADRASLFLVDSKSKELYATIFDIGTEGQKNANDEKNDQNEKTKNDKIRFPLGTGIAGHVALTGEVLNIADAYSDSRFNKNVDQITGYKTESILCMPIYRNGLVIGVVEMINKKSGVFTEEDEESFELFAVYCGLALYHTKLYEKIKRSEQKYKVALEVLSYHNTAAADELKLIYDNGLPNKVQDIDNYFFDPYNYDDFNKGKFAVFMFMDLFGCKKFDKDCLTRFILTIKKNYRRVPYHNWNHGFSVANTMYTILKRNKNIFRPLESLALYIASLCHDLDHRGKNNKFMIDIESPIAAVYTTSTMEHHHFNQTVVILQQDGHNIFSNFSNTEFKQILGLIKHCIIATDLALFFPNKAKLASLIEEEKFSWSNLEHRLLVQTIAMTASDLSASAKPWDTQIKTVKMVFEEFYEQGDAELAAGRTPMPMMDRRFADQKAASQVGFLTAICLPCYSLLSRLIPETKILLDMCQKNLERWQQDAEQSIKS